MKKGWRWRNVVPGAALGEFGQGWATKRVEYSHDLFTKEALQWIEKHDGGPFFLYLALTIPHANNEGMRATTNGQEVPDLGVYKDKELAGAEQSVCGDGHADGR